jgi:hypothetical protein
MEFTRGEGMEEVELRETRGDVLVDRISKQTASDRGWKIAKDMREC